MGLGLGSLFLLGGAAIVFQNSLFNVDGGHRAIKYRRVSGVGKDIYTEGRPPDVPRLGAHGTDFANRSARQEHTS